MDNEHLLDIIEDSVKRWAGTEDFDLLGWHAYLKDKYASGSALETFVCFTFDFSGDIYRSVHVILPAGSWSLDDYARKIAEASLPKFLQELNLDEGITIEAFCEYSYVYLDDWYDF